jgi:AcrR family transcriptional regulator
MPAIQGRQAQKTRTREALLDGARALMLEGATLTVTAAAERAGISKATAYRYFSDPAVMAAEAGLAVEVKPYEEIVAGARTVPERIRAISLYFFDLAVTHEAAFRQFLARSLDAWAGNAEDRRNRRGARRVAMFAAALDPICGRIGADRSARLVNALSAATGTEAMIALFDVVGADPKAAQQAVLDITDALIAAHLPPGES